MGQATSIRLPETATARGKISPARIAHVVFKTSNFKEMVDWWCKVLEAEPAMSNDELAFLTFDEEHHRIAILNIPLLLPTPKVMRGLDHVAFTYRSLQDLLATFQRLQGIGITPAWAINHGPTTSLYYPDPDGNTAELQVENFENAEAMLEWAKTADFTENPIGVDFEPAELLARLQAGEPESELKKRQVIGKRSLSSAPVEVLGYFHKFLATVAGK
ncbi:MAG: catechol 2,3-dioxygenase-like lactoylglutathione lyase family enzyme [Hyphomicrobiaceae bacterium]|jgi:catechol 2,3-dioxygenase-like lactoylglutathione lyase family enzyme